MNGYKLGYHLEGVHRDLSPAPEGSYDDVERWTLLRRELPGSVAASAALRAWDAGGRLICDTFAERAQGPAAR